MAKKVLLTAVIAVLVICLTALLGIKLYSEKYLNTTPWFKTLNNMQTEAENKDSAESKTYFNKPVNILVVGVDKRPKDAGRSDTIMIYHLDPLKNSLDLLSVPRDTYVNIPGRGMDKVNHAYAFGGINLTKKTLEDFLGIKIDYYVVTNFEGFVGLIDQVGPITVNVEKDISGTDIKKGSQKMDGQTALAYVRDRQDPMGDIARVGRQQRFMKALAIEVSHYEPKWKLILQIPQMYQNSTTDLPLQASKQLFAQVEQMDMNKARMEKVPGWFYNLNGISYWRPDLNQTKLIVQELFLN